jgi:hypothetical protein
VFNAPLFYGHIAFMQFHSEILPLRDFVVRYRLRTICSCDFIVRYRLHAICSCDFIRRCHLHANLPPSCDLDSEICVCKLAEKASPLVYALKWQR